MLPRNSTNDGAMLQRASIPTPERGAHVQTIILGSGTGSGSGSPLPEAGRAEPRVALA